jgi:hypothetical protein
MQLIKPDTLEDLTSALNDLLADEVVCITADDFTKLTGDDLNFPVTEGRFLIGNLSARANCASCCLPICSHWMGRRGFWHGHHEMCGRGSDTERDSEDGRHGMMEHHEPHGDMGHHDTGEEDL